MAGHMVHQKSFECVKSELDLFQSLPTQTSMEKGTWHEIAPSSAVTEDGPLEFHVSGSGDEYIDLLHTQLYLKAKIVNGDGSAIGDETDVNNIVAPVNLLLQSLFSQLEVTLNGKIIGHMNTLYPYRAMLETLLNYGREPLTSQLQTSLFYKDTASYMDSSDPRIPNSNDYLRDFNANEISGVHIVNRAGVAGGDVEPFLVTEHMFGNGGLNQRWKFTRANQWFDLIGPLHGDLFMQDRYLVNGVDLGVRLIRSKSKFHLMAPGGVNSDFRVQLSDAYLFVRKVKVADSVFLAHQHTLTKANMVYPLTHTVLKSFSIPSGNLVGPSDNIFVGQLPTEMVVVFVDGDAANGSYSKNPFNFKTMDIQQFMVKFDGVQVPAKPISTNFEPGSGGIFMRAYQSLFSGTGKLCTNQGSIIRRQDYSRGYAIFAFDFRADLGSRGHYSLRRNGCVQVDVRFKEQLPNTINMIVCGEFDSFIEVTRSREIISFGVA